MTRFLPLALVLCITSACGLFGVPGATDNIVSVKVTDLVGTGTQAAGGDFDAKLVTGRYSNPPRAPASDAGYSSIIGTPAVFESSVCKTVTVSFVGKPEAGKTWVMDGRSTLPDGGLADAGSLEGRGWVTYGEGCFGSGKVHSWTSSAGTLTVDSVKDPTSPGAGAVPGAIKTVAFTLSGVQLGPASTGTQGTMALSGRGNVLLFLGMNLP